MVRKLLIRISSLLVLAAAFTLQFACGSQNTAATPDDRLNKPLATPKTDGNRPKIIAFGDSLTAGFGLTEKESYPNPIQQMLHPDGYEHVVINAGVSGDTSHGGLERVDWVLAAPNVRIMFLELGANDLLRGGPRAKMKEKLETI